MFFADILIHVVVVVLLFSEYYGNFEKFQFQNIQILMKLPTYVECSCNTKLKEISVCNFE